MKVITSRAAIQPEVEAALLAYKQSGEGAFLNAIHTGILKKKVKYPVLEYVATVLYNNIPAKQLIDITDGIITLKENGSEVIAGKILQLRLPAHYKESIDKAIAYIVHGEHWLPCDTIGERVLGHALLTTPERTLPVLAKLTQNDNKWIVRSVGVAGHYAIKKGLRKEYVDKVFQLLLGLANTTDFHTKKGIGWAAKTASKFHPDIIALYRQQIDDDPAIKQWFKTKIKIGLGRTSKYAGRYTG